VSSDDEGGAAGFLKYQCHEGTAAGVPGTSGLATSLDLGGVDGVHVPAGGQKEVSHIVQRGSVVCVCANNPPLQPHPLPFPRTSYQC
jgi:hypothetical protein